MSEITYDDKVDLQVATNISNINKVTASDMNEIKNVVNGNAEEVGDITSLTTTDKTSVVNAVNELNAPEKWVSVGATAPTDGRRVWFAKGKNLYNENAVSLGTISQTDGKTITSNASVRYTPYYIKITPNTSYTLSYSGTTSLTIRAFYYNANYDYLNTSVIGSSTTSQTFTTPQTAYYIRLQFGADYYAKSMQLEEGSTATTYEAYIEQSINVDNSTLISQDNLVSVGANQPGDGKRVWFAKGKNLFDIDNAYHGTIGATGGEGSNEDYRTSYYIATTPNTTYYFSSTQISGQTSKQLYLAYYDSNKTFLSRTSYNLYESAFTTPSNCYYIRAGVYSAGQENVMLELGSQKTTYEPYVEPSINVDGEELNFDNYSTNEQVIGKWIDGKNIYRRTYKVTNISSSNVDLVDISGLNIDTIVKLYGFVRSQAGMCMPMPLTDSASNYNVLFLSVNKIRGRVVFGTGGSIRDCYVTIEYTKK